MFVDASSTGIGFTLAQIQNAKEVVIAYNGRGLNQAERNYSTTEREALALVEELRSFNLIFRIANLQLLLITVPCVG